jgi:hypothetical protein
MENNTNNPAPAPTGPISDPAMPPAPESKIKRQMNFNNKMLWIYAAIFGVISIAVLIFAFAANKSGPTYYWSQQNFFETYWDGQVHSNKDQCIYMNYVCHGNGKLAIANKTSVAWESDPSKNSPKALGTPTWFGPYVYGPGPWYGYSYGVTGRQQVCFIVKDVSSGNTVSKAVFQIHNEAAWGQTGMVVKTIEGQLGKKFKKAFSPVCISYTNNSDAYAQEYRVWVRSGKIQIDNVTSRYEYYTDFYDPYPYNTVIENSNIKDIKAKPHKIPPPTAVCPVELKDTTTRCTSKSDLSSSAAEGVLTNVQVDPALTYSE